MNEAPNTNPPREEEIHALIDELQQSANYFENQAPSSCKKAITVIENLWGTVKILESALDKFENIDQTSVTSTNPHRRYRIRRQ